MPIIKTIPHRGLQIARCEILGYLNVKGTRNEALDQLIEDCIEEMLSAITFRICYEEFPARFAGENLDLGFSIVKSRDLAERIKDCQKIILLAATLGLGPDRLIARYSLTEPSRAVVLQAVASAVIEAGLDAFCRELTLKYKTRDRFSCGYGDLPLELQRDIFKALNCEKAIGLTLNDSFLMSPSKSVTAIIGIESK